MFSAHALSGMRKTVQIVAVCLLLIGMVVAGMIGYSFARRKAAERGMPGAFDSDGQVLERN